MSSWSVLNPQSDPGRSYALALITRAIVVPPIPVVAIIIILVAQPEKEFCRNVAPRDPERTVNHTTDPHELSRRARNPNQTVIQAVRIGTLWIDISLPGFSGSPGLDTTRSLYRHPISLSKGDARILRHVTFYVRLLDSPDLDIWAGNLMSYLIELFIRTHGDSQAGRRTRI
jgi:hypothetical protein